MELSCKIIEICRPEGVEVILGQGTFNPLAIEELHHAVAVGAPKCNFGIAFSEASDERLIRCSGNNDMLCAAAQTIINDIGCGHTFIILLQGAFPIQVLNNVKCSNTTVRVIGATGNRCFVVVAELDHVNAILGFADGARPTAVESTEQKDARRRLVRAVGYLE